MSERNIDYQHTAEVHSSEGARAGFRYLMDYGPFGSLLDVGAGMGTWMRAAQEAGVQDVWGIDGIDAMRSEIWSDKSKFVVHDLSKPFDLGRIFDSVICLEVAEHLDASSASALIESLCRHGKQIFFSGACPLQYGQTHVNCQWPSYWQKLFNEQGFVCLDDLRWKMWPDTAVQAWYRQNIFRAVWSPDQAGAEPRIRAVVHPAMLVPEGVDFDYYSKAAEAGDLPFVWYLITPIKAMMRKIMRKFGS